MTESGPNMEEPMDAALFALANRYRRRVLLALLDTEDGEPLHLADIYRPAVDPDTFMLRLHHNHLPRLDDGGYVQWDHETGEVRPGPCFDEIRPFVEFIAENGDRLPGRVG